MISVSPASLALASLVATLTLSSGAFPRAAPKHAMTARVASLGPAALRFGRSVGSPTEGRLVGGMHIDEAPYLRVVPAYGGGDVRWGLEPLVAMIDRAARSVRRRFPDAITSVGHLSRAGGGDVERHRSHESGRDADIGFFVRGASGRQLLPTRFVSFQGDGTAATWPGAYFDDARNWALVAALVNDPEAHVTHLFIAAPLRARLLAYAERMAEPTALRVRAAETMQQPHGALPHDDHFHVRIACPAHMTACVENPAMPARWPSSPTIARGHHARPYPGTTTAAPKRATLPALPAAISPPGTPTEAPPDRDRTNEGDEPPAVLGAPIDDVDG